MDAIGLLDTLFRASASLQGQLRSRAFWLKSDYGLPTVRTPGGAVGDVYYRSPPQSGPGAMGAAMPPIERYVGWCLIDRQCADLIGEVNALKAELKERVIALQHESRAQSGAAALDGELAALAAARSTELNHLLGGKGLRMVNLLKVYRRLPLLEGDGLEAIRWSVTRSSKSISRVSREEVIGLLDRRLARLAPGPAYAAIAGARDEVARSTRTEYARVKRLAPQVKANIIWSSHRQTLHASMPFFIVDGAPPDHNGLALPSDLETPPSRASRRARDDRRIGEIPVVEGLNIYPYLREAA